MNPNNQQNSYPDAAHTNTMNPTPNNPQTAALVAAGGPLWPPQGAQWAHAPQPSYPQPLLPTPSPLPFSGPAGMPLSAQVIQLQAMIAQSAQQLEYHHAQQQQLAQQTNAQRQLQRQQQQLTPLITGPPAPQGSVPTSAASSSGTFSSLNPSPASSLPIRSSAPTPLSSPMPLLQSVSPQSPEAAVAEPSAIGHLPPLLSNEMDEGMEAAAFLSPVLPEVSVKLERSSTGPASQGNTCSSSPNPAGPTEQLSAEELAALDQRSMYAGRRMACAGCHAVKSSCEGGRPCARCVRVGRPCIQREKARQKKQTPEAKSVHKKLSTPPENAGAAAASASSSTWSPGQFRSPPSESTNSSATSSASRSLGDASSPSLTTSPYPSPLGHSMRITSRESSANAAVSPVYKHRKISATDDESTPPAGSLNARRSNRSIPPQTQRSRSPSEALHGMGLRADSSPMQAHARIHSGVFDSDQVVMNQSASSNAASSRMHAMAPFAHPSGDAFSLSAAVPVVDVTALLSSKCLLNHLATGSLAKVRSKIQSKEWSVREAQRFVAELATQLTVADLATLVERSEGPKAASSSLTNTMHRLHELVLLPSSPLFMLSWTASPMFLTPSANMDAELVIERLPEAPPSPNAERKRKRDLEQNMAAAAAGAGAAPAPLAEEPVSARAVPMILSTNLALHQLLGYSQSEMRDRYIQFGNQTPLMFLRPDYVAPFHLLSLQCSLERILEYVCFAVFRSRYGYDLYLCCHVKSDVGTDGTVERTRTIYRLMPSGPLPPHGAHINLLQPYPTSS